MTFLTLFEYVVYMVGMGLINMTVGVEKTTVGVARSDADGTKIKSTSSENKLKKQKREVIFADRVSNITVGVAYSDADGSVIFDADRYSRRFYQNHILLLHLLLHSIKSGYHE